MVQVHIIPIRFMFTLIERKGQPVEANTSVLNFSSMYFCGMLLYKNFLFLTIFFVLIQRGKAQDLGNNIKLWPSVGIQWEPHKNWDINVKYLHSFKAQHLQYNFDELSFDVTYRIANHWYTEVAYDKMWLSSSNFNRFGCTIMHKQKLSGLNWRNQFGTQIYTPTQNKYQWRFYYESSISYRIKSHHLVITPFLTGQLFYYYHGEPAKYYENGNIVETHSTDGLHAFRITPGTSMRFSDEIGASVYCLWQKEFNTSLPGSYDLNSLNKKGTDRNNSFNDFLAIGASLTWNIDSTHEKKQSKNKKKSKNRKKREKK